MTEKRKAQSCQDQRKYQDQDNLHFHIATPWGIKIMSQSSLGLGKPGTTL